MTDDEFNVILAMYKQFKNPSRLILPEPDERKEYKIIGTSDENEFVLDYDRRRPNQFELKQKAQFREKLLPLVRFEIDAPPYKNPDGKWLSRKFDFLIPKSKSRPERIIQTVNRLTDNTSRILTFNCEDVGASRKESQFFTIYNDSSRPADEQAVKILTAYNIHTLNWSQRIEFIYDLAS